MRGDAGEPCGRRCTVPRGSESVLLSSIRRRHFLSVLAGGALAGCSSEQSEPTVTPVPVPDIDTATDPSERRAEGRSPRTYDVTTITGLDRTIAVILTDSTTDPPVLSVRLSSSPDRPPLLSGTVANPSSTSISVDLGQLPTFSAIPDAVPVDGSRHDSIMLAPRAGHDRRRFTPPLERGPDGWWLRTSAFESPWVETSTIALQPGERFWFEYAIIGRRTGTGLVPGRYRFAGDERTVTLVVWQTSAPGLDVDSRVSNPDPPSLPVDGQTIWYHDTTPETAVSLGPTRQRVTLPGRVTYRLVNHSQSAVATRWHFLKLADGDWYDLTPTGQSTAQPALVPGETRSWDLSLAHDSTERDGLAIGHLGGGRYAFVVDEPSSSTVRAALLSVEAPPLTITPDENLAVSRDGATITVTARGDDSATLTATRDERADTRLVREHVQRLAGLRNTLAFFEDGVERVVLRTDADTVRAVLGDARSLSIQVAGNVYHLEKSLPD